MKLTESHLRNLIKQELTNILEAKAMHPAARHLQLRKTGSEKQEHESDWGTEPYMEVTYNIVDKDGNVVGSIKSDSLMGRAYGTLFGKQLDLSGYGGMGIEDAHERLHSFARSKTGNKWLDKNAPK
jgi:hypothetical protein